MADPRDPDAVFVRPATGFCVYPGLFLVTQHQVDGLASRDELHSMQRVDSEHGDSRDQNWIGSSKPNLAYVFGHGRVPYRLRSGHTDYRTVPSGWLDFGWSILEMDGIRSVTPVVLDFDRPLLENEVVYAVRPMVAPGDLTTSLFSNFDLDAHLDKAVRQVPEFEWWQGRVVPLSRVPEFNAPSPAAGHAFAIAFPIPGSLGGMSGSPVLIRDGKKWVVVGMVTSGASSARLGPRSYSLGVAIRPRGIDSEE